MIRIMIGIIIGVAVASSMAQADDQAHTDTPKQFVSSVAAVPGWVHNHLQTEWQDIKAYQAASWVDARAQSARTWARLKSLFNTTKTNR